MKKVIENQRLIQILDNTRHTFASKYSILLSKDDNFSLRAANRPLQDMSDNGSEDNNYVKNKIKFNTKWIQEVCDLFDASGDDFDVLPVSPVLLNLFLNAFLLKSCHFVAKELKILNVVSNWHQISFHLKITNKHKNIPKNNVWFKMKAFFIIDSKFWFKTRVFNHYLFWIWIKFLLF